MREYARNKEQMRMFHLKWLSETIQKEPEGIPLGRLRLAAMQRWGLHPVSLAQLLDVLHGGFMIDIIDDVVYWCEAAKQEKKPKPSKPVSKEQAAKEADEVFKRELDGIDK